MDIKNAEAYGTLSSHDLNSLSHPKGKSESKKWVSSFINEHLPSARLKNNQNDMSSKYEYIGSNGVKKKSVPKLNGKKTISKKKMLFTPEVITDIKYSSFLSLNELWIKYMEDLIQFSKMTSSNFQASAAQKMMKADLHGCHLTVRQSKCPSFIGVHGIVIKETRNMFQLITPENKIKNVPKMNSIFCVALHGQNFTIFGNQFTVKPGERASKKFKSKPSIDL